jgi:hypothetical protein
MEVGVGFDEVESDVGLLVAEDESLYEWLWIDNMRIVFELC